MREKKKGEIVIIEIIKEEGNNQKNLFFKFFWNEMGFGSWIKKIGQKIKNFGKDFVNGFKHGWNKTKSVIEKIPIVGDVASAIPAFDNTNNPVSQHFKGDGYIKFDDHGNRIE